MTSLPALDQMAEHFGFLTMSNVRKLAQERMQELEDMNISKRDRAKLLLISSLDDESLQSLLNHLRSHYFHHKPMPSKGGLQSNYISETPISVVLKDKYREISAEEQYECREFIKNFVYAGGQFLYAKVDYLLIRLKTLSLTTWSLTDGCERVSNR